MGWDAYAFSTERPDALFEYDYERHRLYIPDQVYARAFRNAEIEVLMAAPSVDGLLVKGGLDCSDCAEVLEQLTGLDAWGDPLSIEAVQSLTIKEYEPEIKDAWAYYSALWFLKTCQDQKLGIKFSW